MSTATFFERVRLFELQLVKQALAQRCAPGMRVLEVGAGTGWQARELTASGYVVEAIDIPLSNHAQARIWPIRDFDGCAIPFPDASFDVIFSSNVIEHVEQPDELHSEMHRVLRPSGFAIHMVPTSAWRLWSLLSHYPALARDIVSFPFRQRPPPAAPALGAPEAGVGGGAYRRGRESALAKLTRRLVPRRHGSRGTAIGELEIFSEASWMRHFTKHGWRLEESRRGGIWLTGDMLLGAALPIAFRTKASRVLGSTALMLVMRAAADHPDPSNQSK